jgi:putative membrane protein
MPKIQQRLAKSKHLLVRELEKTRTVQFVTQNDRAGMESSEMMTSGMMAPGLMVLLFWLPIILGIVILVLLLFWVGRHVGPGRSTEDRALTTLRERYARGEIDKADYEARKSDLLT